MRLYRSLRSRFILPEVVPESDDVLSIDLEAPDVLKDFNSIFTGAKTKQYARDSDIIGTSEYKRFLKEVRTFFIKYAKYLQTSLPVLKNDVINPLTFLCLPERHKATLDELMQRFPRVITDMNALESEFLEHQATPDDKFPAYFDEDDKFMCIDHIFHQIAEQIDLYSVQPRFKHLAEFAKFLICFPLTNSYCESIFSIIRKICADDRHNLREDATQHHASTSVYTETLSIKNNLLGILIPKRRS